ncbi:rRNA maturation RNase YbeY [Rubrobacter taiwanensis]|nr:rRNA maturation RNase YbeY [Rubrobacter taiwanensis]
MTFSVEVVDEAGYGLLSREEATRICAQTFAARGLELDRLGEVSVALVDLPTIRNLNLKYRGIDSPTDVLTFTIDGMYGEMAGEIVIAPGYVGGEASAVEELVVHGALHMSGMDHGEEFEGSEMFRVQEAVLRELRERG